ncbi:MAG: TonB-dependent siderophore receptor [Pseudomonadota bacterium]
MSRRPVHRRADGAIASDAVLSPGRRLQGATLRAPSSALRPVVLAVHLLAAGVMLGTAGWAPQARAQTAAQPVRSYNIPAGPLTAALNRFAEEAGVLMSAPAELTQGKMSPGLSGSFTVEQGFAGLMRGLALQAVRQVDGSYALRAVALPAPAPAAAMPAKQEAVLPAVRVTASGERGATSEGSRSYGATAATVGKTEQALKDIPQSVSVLTRQRIDDQNLSQMELALDQMTGLQLDTATGFGSANVYSRGFLINNYQIDGVPQTFLGTSFTGADLAAYDRVEVIRGAAGLLQGVGNPSATVHLVRKKPTREFAAHATVQAGSWDYYRAEADAGGALNTEGSLRGRVVAVHEDREHFVNTVAARKTVLYGVLELDLGARTTATLGIHGQRVDATPFIWGLPRYSDGRSLELPRSTTLVPAWNRWSQDITDTFFNLAHQLDGDWKLNLGFNNAPQEQDFKRSVTRGTAANGGVNPANPAGSIFTGVRWQSEGERRNLDAHAAGPLALFGRRHDLVVGINAIDYVSDTRQTAFFPAVAIANVFAFDPYSVPEPAEGPFTAGTTTRTRQLGLYASGRFSLTDPLKLILGARLGRYTTRTDSHNLITGITTKGREVSYDNELTPYAGLVFDLDKTYSVYASYADIFTPQTAQFTASGDELKPIVGANHEAGIKAAYFEGALNASLAAFRIDQRNRAQEDTANPCATATIAGACYVAEGEVRSEGLEAEVSGRLTADWNLFAGYTYNKTRYLKDRSNQGQPFRTQTPRHLLKLWTDYRLPLAGGRWNVGGGIQAQSSYYALDGTVRSVQPAFAVASLRVGYRFSRQASAALSVNNIFDKTYYSGMRGVSFGNSYGDPRNVVLAVRVDY